MFLGISIFLIGLAVGSFVNVLLYRLPRDLNFINSRSRCPHCSSQLKWFDLIPILSFIVLRGRCRCCKAKISPEYPIVELSGGSLIYLGWIVFQIEPWLAVFWMVILIFLLILFLFDLKYYILPDIVIISLVGFVVIYRAAAILAGQKLPLASWGESLISALVILLILGAIWFFSHGRWLGFGDVKFGFVLGVVFGVYGGLFIFYSAVIIGGILALVLLILGRANMKTKLPLGTFLSIASITYIFYQTPVNNFLHNLFLI